MPGQTVSTPGGSYQTPGHWSGGSSTEHLSSNFSFIIWDYKENQAIVYGLGDHGSGLLFGMNNGTWKNNFRYIAAEIFKNSPFFRDFFAR